MGTSHSGMIGRRVADLRRLRRTREGDRSVNLGRSGSNGRGRSADATSAGPRRRRTLRGLRSKAVRHRALRILLERGLLRLRRRRRRRNGKTRWALSHLVLRTHLLVLRRRRGGRGQLTLATACHDAIEEAVTGSDGGGLLRRASMGRRTANAGRRVATSSLKLAA